MGAEVYAYLKVGYTSVTARFDGKFNMTNGENIKLAMDKESLHLFDKETQLSIV